MERSFSFTSVLPSLFSTFALGAFTASSSQGAVFFDDFSGATIDNTIWDTPPTSGADGGSFVQSGGHLGFDSGGDVNGREVEVQLVVSTGINPVITRADDWRFDVQVFLNDSSFMSSAAPQDAISLNVRVENPNDGGDSMELNLAMLDPSAFGGPAGIDHVVRFGTRTDDADAGEQITLLGTGAVAAQVVDLRAEYDATAGTITGYYDIGGGYVQFTPTTSVADWGMAITDEFLFSLDAGTFNFMGNPTGNFSVDGSKAHFGSAELSQIPEPDVIFLILLGIAVPLIRHRRRAF